MYFSSLLTSERDEREASDRGDARSRWSNCNEPQLSARPFTTIATGLKRPHYARRSRPRSEKRVDYELPLGLLGLLGVDRFIQTGS